MTKSKIKKSHPFDRLQEWEVPVPVYINPDWAINLVDGISLDIEHDGNGKWVGLGIYIPSPPMIPSGVCYYWSDLELIKGVTLPKFIAHNGVSDIKYLKSWGFDVSENNLIWDTFLMQHILDSSQRDYGLKAICKREGIGEWPDYKEIVGKDKTLLDFPVEMVAQYNAWDCYGTYKLMEHQKERLY